MSKVIEIQPAVITTFALSDLMALSDGYPDAPVPLVAEPKLMQAIVTPIQAITNPATAMDINITTLQAYSPQKRLEPKGTESQIICKSTYH